MRKSAEELSDSQALQVLVVDDNTDAADMLAILLRHRGHEVQVAYSGALALELALVQQPSVILLDIGLPQMDGYKVARELRERPETRDALIIAVTGYGLDGDRARARAAGFDLHLLKPIDAHQLFEVLAEHPRLAVQKTGT